MQSILPFTINRTEYLIICQGNACASKILSLFESWSTAKLDRIEELAGIGKEVTENDEWIYNTIDSIYGRMLGDHGRNAVVKGLKLLEKLGLIKARFQAGTDRTKEYWLDHGKLKLYLDHLHADEIIDFLERVTPETLTQRHRLKINDASFKSNQCIVPNQTMDCLEINDDLIYKESLNKESSKESEKSTASADAPSSSNQGKKKAPPKILTKKMTQRLVDVYQELKPARWGDVKVLNDKRIGMADRAYQACGQDIEATIQIVRDALSYVSTQEWWTSKRFTFGTLFERGDGGQGDYRFIRWSELSTSQPDSVDASDTPELTVMQRIGRQLKRLNRSGRLPHDWERETGCTLASDLSESQQQQYLEELLQEPDPPAKPDFTGPPRQISIPVIGQTRRSA
ncbi:hypothetical protein D0962_22990 [Leptolyngbyaceae cyanobacterium CCMR0082]|uniref:Uncharacterized protein n=1 Tax=Adonisia turfae CCMR0082 TaxID=2304604 RepID=A0A6M0SBA1_9CYAN|nr:hypothetical protein [Adonisia turfae]NEZ65586.1 hypothetical protein [Adonisia turfae CCMR0082]